MKNKLTVLFIVVFFALSSSLLFSCRATKAEKENEDETKKIAITEFSLPINIAPQHCRIAGTIVSIDTTRQVSNPNDPCMKAPCVANVKVDSILGYGSAFPKPFWAGERISVKFVFTLSPTEGLIPNMTESFPGLNVGSRFLADVEGSSSPRSQKSSTPLFSIYGYKVQ